MKTRRLTLATLVATLVAAAVVTRADDLPEEFEVHFELKLLGRHSVWGRRVALDMWAGGRLLMRAAPASASSVRYELLRPLEDPWVFRWYDAKDEVKLGAAVSVPEPRGHPYGALREVLEPLARDRYAEWWDADRVEPTAPRQPAWSARADRFWAERHRGEGRIRDPLHRDPVYPFHVLGDPTGRFVFETRPDGAVITAAIRDRMSEPWLPGGWSDWLTGKRREGYGYWETGPRPPWEPATYPALAAALRLLGWSCLGDGGAAGTCRVADGDGPVDLAARLRGVVEILNPRLAGKIDWRDTTPFEVESVVVKGRVLDVVAASPERALDEKSGTRYRMWRFTRVERPPGRVLQDELLALVEDTERGTIKLWLRIGYRPFDGTATTSGTPPERSGAPDRPR